MASAQAVVNLSQQGPSGSAVEWIGDQANARAGASMFRADMSGDVDRADLIVGAPGGGPNGEGRVFVLFMNAAPAGTVGLTSAANAIVTGAAAGDQFGAATAAGMIVRREVAPLPPRDLLVGAPAALGGRGAVYVFAGPFGFSEQRAASAATFRVLGAAGDRLGSAVIAVDIDGDGYRDIVMSAPGTGRIYVIFGGPSLSGTRDLSVQAADLTMTLPGAFAATFGSADWNNDGFKDLAIGVPGAANGAGTVFILLGRPRSAFAGSFALATGASAVLNGIDPGDAAGTTVQNADFDGDGVQDLVITAPGGGGPGNSRPNAGEAYIFWGRTAFSVAAGFAGADVTIYGAAAGNRFGASAAHGNVRRDLSDDLIVLAPGASAAGDVDVVYGLHNKGTSVIDLAANIDRVLHGNPSAAPIQLVGSSQITGRGEDIIAAAPGAAAGGNASAGILFAAYSPTLDPSPAHPSVTLAQGTSTTVTLDLTNLGTLNIPWAARSNTSWLNLSPGTGTASSGASGQITLSIAAGNLAPGTYNGGVSFVSLSRDLIWPDGLTVTMVVTPGNPTGPPPTGNPFGVPDPPDEGSPNGVATPAGSNVQVLPVKDVLVTFASVSVPGQTHVDVVANTHTSGNGMTWSPWLFRVWTTASYTGPVTIGMAYDASLDPPPGAAIRVYDDDGRAGMQSADPVKRLLFATTAQLSIQVTIETTTHTDFNDDGHRDLVWSNDASGASTVWFLGGAQGSTLQGWSYLAQDGIPGWRVVATADLNHDGHPDLIWQNSQTRQVTAWFMGGPQGNVMQSWTYLSPAVLTGWRVAAVTDFDGDGCPDLLWQNDSTRQVTLWFMGGAKCATMLRWTWVVSSGAGSGFQIVGVADFDGDGHPDILWQNDFTRQALIWYMGGADGASMLGSATVPGSSIAGWRIAGAVDIDGDGQPDIVWQNDSTRQVVAWYMGGANGATMQSWNYISTTGVPGWTVIAK